MQNEKYKEILEPPQEYLFLVEIYSRNIYIWGLLIFSIYLLFCMGMQIKKRGKLVVSTFGTQVKSKN